MFCCGKECEEVHPSKMPVLACLDIDTKLLTLGSFVSFYYKRNFYLEALAFIAGNLEI